MTYYRYLFIKNVRLFGTCYFLFSCIFIINYLATHLEYSKSIAISELLRRGFSLSIAHSYILIPLALLISGLWVYMQLQTRMELCAFLTQGISKFSLIKPYVHLTLILFLTLVTNLVFFDKKNEAYIASFSRLSKVNHKNVDVEILPVNDGYLLICTNLKTGPAYLKKSPNILYYTSQFNRDFNFFHAEQHLLFDDSAPVKIGAVDLCIPVEIPVVIKKDPSKLFQTCLIWLAPFLVLKSTFIFSRVTKPLLILAKNSTLFVILNILGKSLCHLISKII